MLELICDQAYTWSGIPADKSPYRNHGTALNTVGSFDGVEPGSGTILFPHPNSRVRIAAGLGWQPLTALKIDVLARVNLMAQAVSVLVAGHGSFRFGLSEGALEAQFDNATGTHNYVRAADAFSPDHTYHPVPANKWVKLGFHHDGFARMRLFVEDELVGEAIVEGGVPSVQGLGVSIGNHVDQDGLQFPGEIDEVRIWRLDPKAMKREFLGRPYTVDTARCWVQLFEEIVGWAKTHPEQQAALVQQCGAVQRAFLRALFLLPDSEQAKLRAALVAFGDLWFAGRIAGPEMQTVLCHWVTLLRACGLDPGGDPAGTALAAMYADVKIDSHARLECDPELDAFLRLLRKAVDECGKVAEAQ